MASYVFPVPAADNLCIVIGDDWPGAKLTLSESPGTGEFFAHIANKGQNIPLVVLQNSPTDVDISLPESGTNLLSVGTYRWSLLFRTTASPTDRTVCVGFVDAVDYPTSGLVR